MKKTLAILCCVLQAAILWAEKPRRIFEWGFDAGGGAYNSYLPGRDIFNPARTLKVDLDALARRSLDLGLDLGMGTFFALNLGETWAFRLDTGVEAQAYGSLPRELTAFLAEGNGEHSSFEGNGSFGLSVFAATEISGQRKFGQWTVGVTPAFYVPVAYAAGQKVRTYVESEDVLKAGVSTTMRMYSLIPLKAGEGGSPTLDASQGLNLKGGVDLSGHAEYALFPFLDLGGSLTHLPIVPAVMTEYSEIDMDYTFDMGEDSLMDLFGGDLDLSSKMEGPNYEYNQGQEKKRVYRPLRIEAYARYKPFERDWIRIALKPALGFSLNTIYNKPCFNLSLESRFDFWRYASLILETRLRERVWRQRLALELNMKVLELDIGIASQSQNFTGSFLSKGLGVTVGFRLGW